MLKYLIAAAVLVAGVFAYAAVTRLAPPARVVCVTGSLSSTGRIYLPSGVNILVNQSDAQCKALTQ